MSPQNYRSSMTVPSAFYFILVGEPDLSSLETAIFPVNYHDEGVYFEKISRVA